MEIVGLVLGVWLLAALGIALVIGRFIRVADRRERGTIITASGMPGPTGATAPETTGTEAQETA